MPLLPEDRRSGIERASRRKVRLTLIAAIAVVIGGLLALGAVVLVTLGPQVTELSRIGQGGGATAAAGALDRAEASARRLHHAPPEGATMRPSSAEEVRGAAAAVHTSLVRSLVASSALAILVMAGALVLLRQALHAVEAHEALVGRHADELAAFAARAAHELRTPLQSIGLSLQLLRKGGGAAGAAGALDRAEASARRLAETIDDILRFSRAGGAPEPGASCRVGAIVDAVATELGPRASDVGLELVTDASGTLDVAMAEGHLRTVLQNLVGNAIKYGRSEGGSVTVRAAPQGGWAVLSVSDTGPGIPRDALEHVFEPFFRASTQPEGYGLGLSTVKRLVEAHGGSVRLTSAPGAGTTVTVELPRSARQRDSPTALPS